MNLGEPVYRVYGDTEFTSSACMERYFLDRQQIINAYLADNPSDKSEPEAVAPAAEKTRKRRQPCGSGGKL